MRITDIRLIHGANQWDDNEQQLVVLTIDLDKYEGLITHKIDGLSDRIKDTFHQEGLYSVKEEVDHLLEIMDTGITLAELIGRTAVIIQKAVELDSRFLKSRELEEDKKFVVVFSSKEEEAGSFAAEVALDLVHSLVDNVSFNLEPDIRKLERIRDYWYLGLSTGSVVNELNERGIPYMREKDDAYILFGYGSRQKRIQATISGNTSFIGVDLAGDKDTTKYLLREAGIPVPEGIIVYDQDELNSAIKTLGFPVVIKPLDGNHGRGITVNVRTMGEAFEAFDIAQHISTAVIIERYIQGFDYRLLVINYKFVAALKRTRAFIKGDGKSTVEELISNVNREPRRQKKPGNILTPITIDNVTLNLLKKQGLGLDSILEKDEILYVKETANVSTGAVPSDVTDLVHPHNIFQAERIARLIGLDICGVDLISPNISIPFQENRAAIVEVNAAPGIRMHMEPAEGKPRNVAKMIGDMLFPEGETGVIPIIAVSGGIEKTDTVKLLSGILNHPSQIIGYTSSEGVCINNITFRQGKHTGHTDQRFILKDPTVDLAIFEVNESDAFNRGLAYHQTRVSVITRYPSQQFMSRKVYKPLTDLLSDIVSSDGDLVFNGDDEQLKYLASEARVRASVYTLSKDNPLIDTITRKGGFAAIIDDDEIRLVTARDNIHIAYIKDEWRGDGLPEHILPSVLTAFILRADPSLIARQIGATDKLVSASEQGNERRRRSRKENSEEEGVEKTGRSKKTSGRR